MVSKTIVAQVTVGSNPTPSAISIVNASLSNPFRRATAAVVVDGAFRFDDRRLAEVVGDLIVRWYERVSPLETTTGCEDKSTGRCDDDEDVDRSPASTAEITVSAASERHGSRFRRPPICQPNMPTAPGSANFAPANDALPMLQVCAAAIGVLPRTGLTLDESTAEYLCGHELLLVFDKSLKVRWGRCRYLWRSWAEPANGMTR